MRGLLQLSLMKQNLQGFMLLLLLTCASSHLLQRAAVCWERFPPGGAGAGF